MTNKSILARALPVIALSLLLCGIDQCLEQPTQEGAGPGDDNYLCDPGTGVFARDTERWMGEDYLGSPLGGYIYAPACADRPEYAPVVFFYHMALAYRQAMYDGFYRHLAGKGYIVIAPKYHRPPRIEVSELFDQIPLQWRDAGIVGAKAGYEYYETHIVGTEDVPTPMTELDDDNQSVRLVYGAVGQSFGSGIAAALANPSIRNNIPGAEDFDWNPKAVVMMSGGAVGDLSPRCPGWLEQVYCCRDCDLAYLANIFFGVENGVGQPDWSYDEDRCAHEEYVDGQHCMATDGSFMTGDFHEIDYNPLWIVMAGDADWEGEETPELQAYCGATQITDKHYVRVRSDHSGWPPLEAKHTGPAGGDLFFPIWTDDVDAHDYYAYWKIVTAAMNCAFFDQDCVYARGGTEEQVGMGNWIGGDGPAVKPMQYNPQVWDHHGRCFDLERACELVNKDDPNGWPGESCWKWRGWDGPLESASCSFQIKLFVKGNGAGTVTHSQDPNASCTKETSPCEWNFDPDDPIAERTTILTATADAGSTFSGWGDSCLDVPCTGPSCTLTVDGQSYIIANFDLL